MMFVLRMAMREIRASWQRLLFFFVCIAIGVGSIVALRSVIQSVRVALAGEARTLLGADVVLTSNRPWTPRRAGNARGGAARRPRDAALGGGRDPHDGAPGRSRRRPQRGWWSCGRCGPEFPLYGAMALRDGAYSHALLAGPRRAGAAGAAGAARARRRRQHSDRHGSRSRFAASITAEPGRRIGAFTLGPRVMIDRRISRRPACWRSAAARRTSSCCGCRRRPAGPLATDLRQAFANEFVGVRWYRPHRGPDGREPRRAPRTT